MAAGPIIESTPIGAAFQRFGLSKLLIPAGIVTVGTVDHIHFTDVLVREYLRFPLEFFVFLSDKKLSLRQVRISLKYLTWRKRK